MARFFDKHAYLSGVCVLCDIGKIVSIDFTDPHNAFATTAISSVNQWRTACVLCRRSADRLTEEQCTDGECMITVVVINGIYLSTIHVRLLCLSLFYIFIMQLLYLLLFFYFNRTYPLFSLIIFFISEADRDIADWSGNKPLDYRKIQTSVSASTYSSEYSAIHGKAPFFHHHHHHLSRTPLVDLGLPSVFAVTQSPPPLSPTSMASQDIGGSLKSRRNHQRRSSTFNRLRGHKRYASTSGDDGVTAVVANNNNPNSIDFAKSISKLTASPLASASQLSIEANASASGVVPTIGPNRSTFQPSPNLGKKSANRRGDRLYQSFLFRTKTRSGSTASRNDWALRGYIAKKAHSPTWCDNILPYWVTFIYIYELGVPSWLVFYA